MNNVNRDIGELNVKGKKLTGCKVINIILGKNGCGKSSLLRDLSSEYTSTHNITYISPERAGQLTDVAHVIQSMKQDSYWLANTRNRNQVSEFKQQTYQVFSKLINTVLKNYQDQNEEHKRNLLSDANITSPNIPTSNHYIDKINKLLGNAFTIKTGDSSEIVISDIQRNLSEISSGEAEIISLAIECLWCFTKKLDEDKKTILLLDEPDVHLHPDLQYKFIKFLLDEIKDQQNVQIFIATHSTPILSALADYDDATVTFLKKYDNRRAGGESEEIKFQTISKQLQNILPVFGTHPLTSIYMESPLLLIEGDTDWMIWQQAVRSSEGKIKFHPVVCDTVNKIDSHEKIASQVLAAVYDQKAKAYSLRDGDGNANKVANQYDSVERLILDCYASENLLLTDEVLTSLGTDWEGIKEKIDIWLKQNKKHKYYDSLSRFKNNYDRQNFNQMKDITNILLSLTGSNKPWTYVIGQVIGKLTDYNYRNVEGSLHKFLGEKLLNVLATFNK